MISSSVGLETNDGLAAMIDYAEKIHDGTLIDALREIMESMQGSMTGGMMDTEFAPVSNMSLSSQLSTELRGHGLRYSDILQSHVSIRESIDNCIEEIYLTKIISRLRNEGLVDSADRVVELAGLQDFEEGEQPLSIESAQGFQDFILKFRELGEPVLGLFPEGTLSAGWRVADNKHLLIEFLDSDAISFAMIGPNDSAPDGKFRLNCRANQERVLKTLYQNGVAQWLE